MPFIPSFLKAHSSFLPSSNFYIFFGVLECVGHSFAYIAHFVFFERFRDSNPQRAAVASDIQIHRL
jgi:hypothetical protein